MDVTATIKVLNTVRRCVARVILQLDLRVYNLFYRWQKKGSGTSDVKLIVFMIDGTLQSLSMNVFKKEVWGDTYVSKGSTDVGVGAARVPYCKRPQ
jgi:hypothetical protein